MNIANVPYPLSFSAIVGVTSFEFMKKLYGFKTRVFQAADNKNLMILVFTVFDWSTRVMDRRTEFRWLKRATTVPAFARKNTSLLIICSMEQFCFYRTTEWKWKLAFGVARQLVKILVRKFWMEIGILQTGANVDVRVTTKLSVELRAKSEGPSLSDCNKINSKIGMQQDCRIMLNKSDLKSITDVVVLLSTRRRYRERAYKPTVHF